eukprot:6970773-Alexandrium_andersonii.AAC.1
MSASLVGSEMCIRDRCCFALFGPWGALLVVASVCIAQNGAERTPRELPVSYTHLTLPTICSV